VRSTNLIFYLRPANAFLPSPTSLFSSGSFPFFETPARLVSPLPAIASFLPGRFSFRKSSIATYGIPCRIAILSSHDERSPTKVPSFLFSNGAPEWPQQVQASCLRVLICELSCGSAPGTMSRDLPSDTSTGLYSVRLFPLDSKSSHPGWLMQRSVLLALEALLRGTLVRS